MKFKKTALGIAAAGAAATLSLASTGAATASPASHPTSHKPKPAPQVTGSRLAQALLPASAFGDGFARDHLVTTGGSLRSAKARFTPGSLTCRQFENYNYAGAFGNTAGAVAAELNINPDFSSYPSTVLFGDQVTLQFANAKAASTVYGQEYAKYRACPDLIETAPDGSTSELANQSITKTTVGKYQAFSVIQTDVLSGFGNPYYVSTTVVLAGTNIYQIDETSGTTDPIPLALLNRLISRTQALYPRH